MAKRGDGTGCGFYYEIGYTLNLPAAVMPVVSFLGRHRACRRNVADERNVLRQLVTDNGLHS